MEEDHRNTTYPDPQLFELNYVFPGNQHNGGGSESELEINRDNNPYFNSPDAQIAGDQASHHQHHHLLPYNPLPIEAIREQVPAQGGLLPFQRELPNEHTFPPRPFGSTPAESAPPGDEPDEMVVDRPISRPAAQDSARRKRKKQPPYLERKEFGVPRISISEKDLRTIRPNYTRLETFYTLDNNGQLPKKKAVRVTLEEREAYYRLLQSRGEVRRKRVWKSKHEEALKRAEQSASEHFGKMNLLRAAKRQL